MKAPLLKNGTGEELTVLKKCKEVSGRNSALCNK